MAIDKARVSEPDLPHLIAWIDEQRQQDHDQLVQLLKLVEEQRETMNEQGILLAQLRSPATARTPVDIRTGEAVPARLADHVVLLERSFDDHVQSQSRSSQAEASLRDRDRRTLAELVQQVDQLSRVVEGANGRLLALGEEIRHERDTRAPFFLALEELGRNLTAAQSRVVALEQTVRRLTTAQSSTEQTDEKRGADLARLDNQVKLVEIRYAREVGEIRRLVDEWKVRADEQLKPIEGVARQIAHLVEQRDVLLARIATLDQALSAANADATRLEATEKSDRAAIDRLAESLEAQARRWEATGGSIWQLGERATSMVDELSQLQGKDRARREEIDGLAQRLDRAEEERRRLESALAESNAVIHSVDRDANARDGHLETRFAFEIESLTQRGDTRYHLAIEHLRRIVEELQHQYLELDAGAS